MKAIFTSSSSSSSYSITSPAFIKIISFSLLSLTLFFLLKHFSFYTTPTTQNDHLFQFNSSTVTSSPPPLSPPTPPRAAVVERTGIINEMGIMTEDFIVGEFDEGVIESLVMNGNNSKEKEKMDFEFDVKKVEKFTVCEESKMQSIPCLGNMEDVSRHCPKNGEGLDCLVPRPKDYKLHIPWPKSRDEVWFHNVPYTHLGEDKGSHNSISRKDDKFIFQDDGVNEHLDQISKMVPEIAFGNRTRVALDIDSGVADFGAYLMERNVTTLSIDVHKNEIQFAIERGVPAMVAAFGSRRFPFPSQAFDLIHCSRCRVNWTLNDGIFLLEANRLLRAGGYFVWASRPVSNNEDRAIQQLKGSQSLSSHLLHSFFSFTPLIFDLVIPEMEDLTSKLCWELVSKEGYIAIWRKPLNNSCYLNRGPDVRPSLCDTVESDNPDDDIWYVNVKACITRLPENGYGANITHWPARLHTPPDRLFSIQMDADTSRRELYKADSKYWNDIVSGYIGAFHISNVNTRNVMDMKARYGGFAAALHDFNVNSWVMNVVPVSGSNTLPVIYDRGLIGVMHDWCEPFDTYPRTFDLLNAAGLFSVEQRRCNVTKIMLEMDRILRPGGKVYIRDTTPVIDGLQVIAQAMGWVTFMFDTGEGPHSNWKLLTCEKRL